MALFEGYERRADKVLSVLKEYGINSIEETDAICKEKGIDVASIVKGVQGICFDNACWAYTAGAAIAIKKEVQTPSTLQNVSVLGLQAYCVPGSVADHRKVGLGHGRLAGMLLDDNSECFCMLAGHESFATQKVLSESATQQINSGRNLYALY